MPIPLSEGAGEKKLKQKNNNDYYKK